MTITPEGLHTVRLCSGIEVVNGITGETGPTFSEYVLLSDYQELQRAHAAALEELARLKAPVEVAGIAARVKLRRGTDQMRKLRGERLQDDPWPWLHEGELLAALESLAVQNGLLIDEVAALKGHAEAMAEYFGERSYGGDGPDLLNDPVIAYRAAYPKDAILAEASKP